MVATIRCHSPTSGFWRECRFERVKLNVLIAWALLGSLKTSRASAFWIIYRGLMAHDGSPAKGSLQWSSLGWRHEVVQHAPLESDWSSWWRAMQTCVIVLLLLLSWSSKITPRFMPDLDVFVCMVKLRLAGKMEDLCLCSVELQVLCFHPC